MQLGVMWDRKAPNLCRDIESERLRYLSKIIEGGMGNMYKQIPEHTHKG
jgi:hypothetical protein